MALAVAGVVAQYFPQFGAAVQMLQIVGAGLFGIALPQPGTNGQAVTNG